MKRCFIRLLPGLNPGIFFKPRRKILPYPLNAAHSHYYFERNAIWQGIKYVGLEPGNELLMPAYNSDTEEQVLELAGLKMKYFDVQPDASYDYRLLEKLVTPQTKALYLIHYFGFAQDMVKAREFCARHNLALFEDCALSLFSRLHDKNLGEFGAVSFFCLRKFLQIPNGGALVINSQTRADGEHSYNHHNLDSLVAPSKISSWIETKGLVLNYLAKHWTAVRPLVGVFKFFVHTFFDKIRTKSGEPKVEKDKFNWRASGISLYLLKRLDYDEIIKTRLENYNYLKKKLTSLVNNSKYAFAESIDKSDRPNQTGGSEKLGKFNFFGATEQPGFVPFCLPLLVTDNRKWRAALAERGIEAGAWWDVDHRREIKAPFHNTNQLRQQLLEIPIHHGLNKKDLDYIAECLNERS